MKKLFVVDGGSKRIVEIEEADAYSIAMFKLDNLLDKTMKWIDTYEKGMKHDLVLKKQDNEYCEALSMDKKAARMYQEMMSSNGFYNPSRMALNSLVAQQQRSLVGVGWILGGLGVGGGSGAAAGGAFIR